VSIAVAGAAHCAVVPLPGPHGFELNDVEGEAAIPVDLLPPEAPPPEPPPPPPAPEAREEPPTEPAAPALHRRPVRDAGALAAAGLDAGPDGGAARADASADASGDGAGGTPAWAGDAGAPEILDAAAPRDPQAIVGAAGAVQADVVLVMLLVNAEVIRDNAVGARMGFLLRGIPEWNDFMEGTDIDPVKDTDWVLISGPSLINSSRDVVLIHYAAPDAVVDRAIAVVSRKYGRGGPADAGVRGVKATLAYADRAERILLRPQPRVLAVVPPSVAGKVARQLVASRVPEHVRPGEAVYLRLVNPHHPMPEVPEDITELRLRVVPREDQGADVFVEGDTPSAEAAARDVPQIAALVRRHDDPITSMITHGLLDHVDVTSDGARVLAHLTATRDHLETMMALVAAFLGLEPPAPPLAPPASSK
jgi:hypothetical protein